MSLHVSIYVFVISLCSLFVALSMCVSSSLYVSLFLFLSSLCISACVCVSPSLRLSLFLFLSLHLFLYLLFPCFISLYIIYSLFLSLVSLCSSRLIHTIFVFSLSISLLFRQILFLSLCVC
uniref:Uncharacterized protein n=1 Tax=Arundo donax TaxID=35708 RepID=A0A0A9DZP9_ARUDO